MELWKRKLKDSKEKVMAQIGCFWKYSSTNPLAVSGSFGVLV